eukprot:gene17108-biopygen4867
MKPWIAFDFVQLATKEVISDNPEHLPLKLIHLQGARFMRYFGQLVPVAVVGRHPMSLSETGHYYGGIDESYFTSIVVRIRQPDLTSKMNIAPEGFLDNTTTTTITTTIKLQVEKLHTSLGTSVPVFLVIISRLPQVNMNINKAWKTDDPHL